MTTRRTFMKSLAVSSLGLSLPMPKAQAAAPIKIAAMHPLSGPFASVGSVGDMGAKLALRVVGKELGIDVQYLSIDDEGNPGRALPKLLSAIQQDGVKIFTGAALSSVGLAASSQIASSGGVYMACPGADEITGSQCRKSTFRWPVPSYGAVEQTVRPLIDMFPKAKRWYTITPKYVFGEALLQRCRAIFEEKGIEHIGNGYHSLADTEFSGIIANVAAAKPDVLALLNFGSQASKTLREAVDFGLKSNMKILLVWDAGLEQYQEIGSDILEGVYIGTQYYHDIDSPGNKRLIEIFKTEIDRLPTYSMVNLYTSCELLLRAIKAAGSAEPSAIITALEGMSYVGPTGDEFVQTFDHQCVKNYYLVRGKSKQAKRYDHDYVEILSFGKSFLTQNQSNCKFT